jgi:hypothetical protein
MPRAQPSSFEARLRRRPPRRTAACVRPLTRWWRQDEGVWCAPGDLSRAIRRILESRPSFFFGGGARCVHVSVCVWCLRGRQRVEHSADDRPRDAPRELGRSPGLSCSMRRPERPPPPGGRSARLLFPRGELRRGLSCPIRTPPGSSRRGRVSTRPPSARRRACARSRRGGSRGVPPGPCARPLALADSVGRAGGVLHVEDGSASSDSSTDSSIPRPFFTAADFRGSRRHEEAARPSRRSLAPRAGRGSGSGRVAMAEEEYHQPSRSRGTEGGACIRIRAFAPVSP